MPDKKTKDETHVAYAGLLAKHILRGASDDASGNFFIYFSELIAGILEPVSMTVAEAQAAAIGGDFLAGQRVIITNPLGDTNNRFFTTARTASDLETRGEGWYQGSAMTGPLNFVIGYNLTDDHISYLYNEKYDNEIVQVGYDFIGSLPLDGEDTTRGASGTLAASTFKHNRLRNLTISFGGGHTEIRNSNLFTSTITTTFNDATDTCAIYECDAFNATVSMYADKLTFIAYTIGARPIGSILFDFRAAQLAIINCDQAELHGQAIGTNIVIDTSLGDPGYIGYGIYDYQGSTFSISGSFNPNVNPDASGISDFTKSPWVGFVEITDTTTSGGVLNTISNHPGIKLRIVCNPSVANPLVIADAAGNIRTPAAATITVDQSKNDWVEVRAKDYDFGNFAVVAFANYT